MSNYKSLPTVGGFSRVFLTQLNVWSTNQESLEIELKPSQKAIKAELKKVIDSLNSNQFNFNDLLIEAEIKVPKAKSKKVKNRTVQKHVQTLSKSSSEDFTQFEEYQSYIKPLLDMVLNDEELALIVEHLWRDAIEQYKLFLRSHPSVSLVEDTMSVFFIGYLIPTIVETIASERLIKNFNQNIPLNCFIPSFSKESSNVSKWPLQKVIGRILESAGISPWELQCFHSYKINRNNVSDTKLWHDFGLLEVKPEPDTKVKQFFSRTGKVNKLKWRDLWLAISPVLVKLDQANDKELKANLYTAYVVHNFSQLCSENMSSTAFKELSYKVERIAKACSDEFPLINSYSENAVDGPSRTKLIREYFPVKRDQILDLGAKHAASPQNLDWMKLCAESNSSLYQGRVLSLTQEVWNNIADGEVELQEIIDSKKFSNMLLSEGDVSFEDCQRLEFLIHQNLKKNSGSSWLLDWFYAKRSILLGDFNEAGKLFQKAFTGGCYRSGPYMDSLIVDILAFCKFRFKTGLDEDGEKFYSDLGSSVWEWSSFIGYRGRWVNDEKTLLPKRENSASAKRETGIVNSQANEIRLIAERPAYF
jgi:hypothetical protein